MSRLNCIATADIFVFCEDNPVCVHSYLLLILLTLLLSVFSLSLSLSIFISVDLGEDGFVNWSPSVYNTMIPLITVGLLFSTSSTHPIIQYQQKSLISISADLDLN